MSSSNEVAGYEFGGNWFGMTKGGKISGMSGVRYNSEGELLADYDDTQGSGPNTPLLVKVYADGRRIQLRPKVERDIP